MASRRGSGLFSVRAWSKALMLLGAVALVAAWIGSTGAFTAVESQRGVSASVASDNALLGLDLADSVDSDTRERLVTVTNNFGSTATVTVELQRASAGTLYAGGNSGSTVSFSLASGASEPVEVVAKSPGAVTFTIVASTDGTTVRAVRVVSVKTDIIPIDILIKPTEDPNPINPDSEGAVPVAILQDEEFDPTSSVNVSSLRFGSADDVTVDNDEGASPLHGGHVEDVDDDGDADLVVHFDADETDFETGDSDGRVVGRTNDGRKIRGDDSVKIVGDDAGGDDDDDGDDGDGDDGDSGDDGDDGDKGKAPNND